MDEIVKLAGSFIRPLENNRKGNDWRDGKFYPYFDISRYSIGYGTLATSYDRSGITDSEAIRRNENHINSDYQAIKGLLSSFRENQKVAILSYAYQYGIGGLMASEFWQLAKKDSLTVQWALRQPYATRRLIEVKKFNEIVSSSQIKYGTVLLFAGVLFFLFIRK